MLLAPLSLLLLAGSRRATSLSLHANHAASRAMAASSGIDDLLPATALAVALVALDEVNRRNDALDIEIEEEQPPRVKLKRRQRRRKDIDTCAWAQLLEDEDLEDHTSISAKQFRTDFRLPYPFFLSLVELVKGKDWFPTAESDACGRRSHPVEHKVRIGHRLLLDSAAVQKWCCTRGSTPCV